MEYSIKNPGTPVTICNFTITQGTAAVEYNHKQYSEIMNSMRLHVHIQTA